MAFQCLNYTTIRGSLPAPRFAKALSHPFATPPKKCILPAAKEK